MSMLNDMIAQVSGKNFQEIADKVGLTPQQVESVIAALGRAEREPEPTVEGGAAKSGIEESKVRQVLDAIGGEDALRRIVGGLSQGGGIGGVMSGLFSKG